LRDVLWLGLTLIVTLIFSLTLYFMLLVIAGSGEARLGVEAVKVDSVECR